MRKLRGAPGTPRWTVPTIARSRPARRSIVKITRAIIKVDSVKAAARSIGPRRLCPDQHFRRKYCSRAARRDRQAAPAGGGQLQWLHPRPAQRCRRATRRGGGVGLPISSIPARWSRREDAIPTRTASTTPRPTATWCAACRMVVLDQWRLGLGLGDRCRRTAGRSPRGDPRHPQLRQRVGADHHPDRGPRRAAPDNGALLHAVGTLHPGSGHNPRGRRRAAQGGAGRQRAGNL